MEGFGHRSETDVPLPWYKKRSIQASIVCFILVGIVVGTVGYFLWQKGETRDRIYRKELKLLHPACLVHAKFYISTYYENEKEPSFIEKSQMLYDKVELKFAPAAIPRLDRCRNSTSLTEEECKDYIKSDEASLKRALVKPLDVLKSTSAPQRVKVCNSDESSAKKSELDRLVNTFKHECIQLVLEEAKDDQEKEKIVDSMLETFKNDERFLEESYDDLLKKRSALNRYISAMSEYIQKLPK